MHVRTDQKLQEQRSVRDGEVPSDDDAQLAPFPVLGTLVGLELDGDESRITRACHRVTRELGTFRRNN